MRRQPIKQSVRRALLALPGGAALLRLRRSLRARLQAGNAGAVFRDRYRHNEWDNAESVSGPGSTLVYTVNIRDAIPRLVDELGVRTILDAPCGDFNWFRAIEWKTPVRYLGGDIVEDLVKRNRTLYGSDHTAFTVLDITRDVLPRADLWLCRDCLFHLSERDIFLTLARFIESDIAYLLTSNHSECELNRDIPTGAFRLLNLRLPPFSLGEPLRVIDDWIEGFPVRHLVLWKREAVRDALASNKAFRRVAK